MPNTYFQFKQFRIDQEHCAMKVCTDACILGAWFASKLRDSSIFPLHDQKSSKRILDLGSGTGLLMMMLAQITTASIDGIEIGETCYDQMTKNIRQNNWSDRLTALNGDARSYPFRFKYDFIISNPPFYENDLVSENESRQVAMHSKLMNLRDLAQILKKNLSSSGVAGIMLPSHRAKAFEAIAAAEGLYSMEELMVRQTPGHNYFRTITSYSFEKPAVVTTTELVIKNDDKEYSSKFKQLMAPYYLHLA